MLVNRIVIFKGYYTWTSRPCTWVGRRGVGHRVVSCVHHKAFTISTNRTWKSYEQCRLLCVTVLDLPEFENVWSFIIVSIGVIHVTWLLLQRHLCQKTQITGPRNDRETPCENMFSWAYGEAVINQRVVAETGCARGLQWLGWAWALIE